MANNKILMSFSVIMGTINVILVVIGFCLLVCGMLIKFTGVLDDFGIEPLIEIVQFLKIENVTLILITSGLLIFTMSLLGLLCVVLRSKFLLFIFQVHIFVLMLGHLIIFLLIILRPDVYEKKLTKGLYDSIEKINSEQMTGGEQMKEIQNALKFYSFAFNCCGINGTYDFFNPNITGDYCFKNRTDGCDQKFKNVFEKVNRRIFLIPNFSILGFELVVFCIYFVLIGFACAKPRKENYINNDIEMERCRTGSIISSF